MTQVDALFQALHDAHPRARQLVRRRFLDGMGLEQLAALYGVTVPAAEALLERTLAELTLPGGTEALVAHRDELRTRLDAAARAWAESPDRQRDDLLRRVAIVLVIVLTAFFYWREANKPKPPPRPRPAPVAPGN